MRSLFFWIFVVIIATTCGLSLSAHFSAMTVVAVYLLLLLVGAKLAALCARRHRGQHIPRIGEYWPGQGGVYAGLMRGEGEQADYHLIVASGSEGTTKETTWGSDGVDEAGARSEWDGRSNTRALVVSEYDHPAAQWAAKLEIDGHSDWYLPACREVALCYATVPELFEKVWYWSSTQSSPDNAWGQIFDYGYQGSLGKDNELRARAVRSISVI